MSFNSFAISNLIILLSSIPLGYFVYLKNRNRWVGKIWLIYSVSIAIWGLFGLLIATTSNEALALLYWQLSMGLGVVWMPVLFHHFAYLYAPWEGKGEKNFLVATYLTTLGLAALTFTPLFIDKVQFVFDSFYYAMPNIAFHIMIVWWFGMLGYSHTKLYLSSRSMPTERQKQIMFFMIASITAYIGGFLDFAVVYGFNWYPWGNFLIAIYPFLMTYAIVRHGLFDIFVFVKRTLITAVAIALVAWIILIIGSLNSYLEATFDLPVWIIPILAGILAVYIGHLFLKNSNLTEKAKQEFITVAAHKLRTPLTHIRHIADELSHGDRNETEKMMVAELKESNLLLIELVNKLLNVANLETKLENYKFGPVNLEALTQNTLKQLRSMAKDKNINLVVNIEPNLPPIEGNQQNVDFVIQSLIENALIYTPNNGKVNINIARKGERITWSVKDTGIGVTKEDTRMIFEKFFRSKSALHTDTEGTGLALFMSRNLIKRQGGTLNVYSEGEGKGSQFWFTLPVYEDSRD